MKATEKEQKGKKWSEPIHSFIIMAYWINVGSRGRQSLFWPKKSKYYNKVSNG